MTMDPERYATLVQLRAEGLPGSDITDFKDAKVKEWLDRVSSLVERITRNYFFEISGTVTFDGNNSHYLHLPYPIREVTSLKVNGDTADLETTRYRVYDGNTPLNDNRQNPKIELRDGTAGSIFTSYGRYPLKFTKGLDQVIEGKFGYLDPAIIVTDPDRTPAVVTEVVMAIVMTIAVELYTRFGYQDIGISGAGLMGSFKKEQTDNHSIEFHEVDDATLMSGELFVPYISQRLKLFKAPLAMRVTSQRWFEGGIG